MTANELHSFKKQLFGLCQTYGVLIRRHGEVRNQVRTDEYFYEIEISAKVMPQKGEMVAEVKHGY